MKRIICAILFFATFPFLLALAGLVFVLRGLIAVIAWLSDMVTPMVFALAEMADGRPLEDQE